jgi:hypothetical protein
MVSRGKNHTRQEKMRGALSKADDHCQPATPGSAYRLADAGRLRCRFGCGDLNRQKQIVMARIIKAFPVPRQFGVA